MEKVKKIILDHDKLFVFAFSILLVSIYALNTTSAAGDELWDFSNIYKMAKGYLIYVDNNVIITPLFFTVGAILFKIFGANFVAFRVYNVLIIATILLLSYIVIEYLMKNKKYSFLSIVYLYLVIDATMLSGANYNLMVAIFILMGILVNISKMDSKYKSILDGLAMFLVFLTKQNAGFFYILGVVIFHLTEMKGKDSENKKEIAKELLSKLLVALVLLIMFLMVLYFRGNLIGFFNYCVLGLRYFHNNLARDDILTIINDVLSIAIVGIVHIFAKKIYKVNEAIEKEVKFVLIQGICFLSMQYPIFNAYHIITSTTFLNIYMILLFGGLINKYLAKPKLDKFLKILCVLSIVTGVAISTIHFVIYLNDLKSSIKDEKYKMYYGTILEEEEKQKIDVVCQYVKNEMNNGKTVIILSHRAMQYNNILNINNGVYDLPFIGNLGIAGEEGIIDNISKMENTLILIIKNEKEAVYQESELVRNYIMENLNYDGDIDDFMIYSTK